MAFELANVVLPKHVKEKLFCVVLIGVQRKIAFTCTIKLVY